MNLLLVVRTIAARICCNLRLLCVTSLDTFIAVGRPDFCLSSRTTGGGGVTYPQKYLIHHKFSAKTWLKSNYFALICDCSTHRIDQRWPILFTCHDVACSCCCRRARQLLRCFDAPPLYDTRDATSPGDEVLSPLLLLIKQLAMTSLVAESPARVEILYVCVHAIGYVLVRVLVDLTESSIAAAAAGRSPFSFVLRCLSCTPVCS